MTDERRRELVAAAVELEQRDAELASSLATVDDLALRAADVRERAQRLDALLAGVPGELAKLEREHAETRDQLGVAKATLAEAEAEAESVTRSRRTSEERRLKAERALAHAREAVVDTAAHAERLAAQRAWLLEQERAARADASLLEAVAATVAAAVRELPRVSESGRAEPGDTLPGLARWADRVHAALLVVRSGLEAEREGLIREAGELATVTFGEPLPGAAVATLRRRLEEAP